MSINELERQTQLPVGFDWVRLGDHVIRIGSGFTPRGGQEAYVPTGIPLIRSQNVHMNRFKPTGLAFISPAQDSEMAGSRVQEDDVLLNITGASIGRVCVADREFCPANVNQHVCVIRTATTIDPEFLAFFLSSPGFQAFIGGSQAGATRQALTKGMIEDFLVPCGPLTEQRRIAARLQEEFAEVARARTAVEAQLKAAQLLPAALLREAFESAAAKLWSVRPLGEVLTRIDAGKCVSCVERPAELTEWGVLKVSALSWGEFRPEENKVLPHEFQIPDGAEVQPGDFLLSRSNTTELVGAVALVRATRPRLMLSDKTLRLVAIREHVVPEFLEFALRTSACRRFIEENATGASSSMKNITQDSIRRIPLPVPAIEDQLQVVRDLQTQLGEATHLIEELKIRLRTIRRLPESLLAEAFSSKNA